MTSSSNIKEYILHEEYLLCPLQLFHFLRYLSVENLFISLDDIDEFSALDLNHITVQQWLGCPD